MISPSVISFCSFFQFEINFHFNLSFVHLTRPNLMAANQLITNPEEAYFNYFEDCQYYDLNSINNYIDTNTPKSFVINIRSAWKYLDEFLINLERTRTKFQVIILTESWLDCQEDFNEIPGYNSFHSFRPKKKGWSFDSDSVKHHCCNYPSPNCCK